MAEKTKYDKVTELSLRRGIFYPTAEIYGSLAGFYDYGSVGTRIKKNFENYWRNYFLSLDSNFFEIEPSNVTPKKVWEASGHLEHFEDPIVKCKKCGNTERADELIKAVTGVELDENADLKEFDKVIKEKGIKCPKCGGELSGAAVLNLMFGFKAGLLDNSVQVFLRPETAQMPYLDFKKEYLVNREKLPLGLAVIGKAYRNEISPRRFFFRMREFTQAELQIFFNPHKLNESREFDLNKKLRVVLASERNKKEQLVSAGDLVEKGYPKFCVYYMVKVQEFYESLNVPIEKMRFYEKNEKERAFYNKLHFDVEVWFDMFEEYLEVAGFHYRGNHDLSRHQEFSKTKLEVAKDGEKFTPHVLELSFGVDRNVFALIDLNYKEEGGRMWLSLPEKIAPWKLGVFPLMKKDGLREKAIEVYEEIKSLDVFYDDSGSIGKRYARADEIGVPYAVTIDHQTLEDNTVTLRKRDSTQQERIDVKALKTLFH